MGMYDTINDEQVKVFSVPVGHGNDVWLSCGSLIYFGDGSEVPYKTWWYNYTKDFNIIDDMDHIFNPDEPIIIHKIRDGKVVSTITGWENVLHSDFDGINLCVSYYGDLLKIRSYKEAEQYLKNTKEYHTIREIKRAKAEGLWKEVSKATFGIANKSEEEKEAAMRLLKEYDAVSVACEKQVKPYWEKLLGPFVMEDPYRKEHVFGERLDLIQKNIEFIQLAKQSKSEMSFDNVVSHLKENRDAWSKRMEEHPEVFQSFLSVCEVSKETVDSIIKEADEILKEQEKKNENGN